MFPNLLNIIYMNENEILKRKSDLEKEWEVIDNKKLKRGFSFKTFMEAIDFINGIAEISENLNHHPDICNSYNVVGIEISTHKIGGLTELDFVLAKRIEKIYSGLNQTEAGSGF